MVLTVVFTGFSLMRTSISQLGSKTFFLSAVLTAWPGAKFFPSFNALKLRVLEVFSLFFALKFRVLEWIWKPYL